MVLGGDPDALWGVYLNMKIKDIARWQHRFVFD
jgi:hypothetical protein